MLDDAAGPAESAGSEADLIARLRAGDRAAAEALVRKTYGGVFAALVRLCGDRDRAAD